MKVVYILIFCIFACSSYETKTPRSVQVLSFNTGMANVYLLKGKINVMIDAGEPSDEKKIELFLKENGISPKDVSLMILTHGHEDHSGTASYFQKTYGIKLIGGRGDKTLFATGKNDELKPTGVFGSIVKLFVKNDYPAIVPDIWIDSNYSLAEYGIEGEIIPLGGHTDGAVAVILEREFAFVGDLLRGSPFSAHSPTEHFFHQDRQKVKNNIKILLDKGIQVFYPGHWGPLKQEDVVKEFF
ncbi:MAG TPA: MBL fold metallo-hydrolase [Leptospiraceae bacterium]|nr:MBL fold metallo-hydrolase [Leptospiraceae bacterium]HMW07595.1 MBL fold metallo-hydrolase [Leptospiraceae bacterium]HMX33027.1 MBL fold metallo-hydrolase [Leptospiraceae bacterium]HMY33190.1 MBL fold metallo-hydrolase [Leptospiraceae bacterium]HMZ66353.1 MBL fold metallo-hydrolase [Leptospiraceae bacterium]